MVDHPLAKGALVRAASRPKAAVTRKRKRVGVAIAVVADLLQMGMFEMFMPGALSPPDDVLDVIVAVLLMLTLGFRWRMLFALALELAPGVALFPSWTAFVLSLPTRDEGAATETSDPPRANDQNAGA